MSTTTAAGYVGDLLESAGFGVGQSAPDDRPRIAPVKPSALIAAQQQATEQTQQIKARRMQEKANNDRSALLRPSPFSLPLIKPIPVTVIPAPTDRVALVMFRQQPGVEDRWMEFANDRVAYSALKSECRELSSQCQQRQASLAALQAMLVGVGDVMSEEQFQCFMQLNTAKREYRAALVLLTDCHERCQALKARVMEREAELCQEFLAWHIHTFDLNGSQSSRKTEQATTFHTTSEEKEQPMTTVNRSAIEPVTAAVTTVLAATARGKRGSKSSSKQVTARGQ